MKIAVVTSSRNAASALALMARLSAEQHETTGLKFNESWRVETRTRIDAHLAGVSHMLAVVDGQDADEAWFSYLVGLARGKNAPLMLYSVAPGWQPAPWIVDIPLFDSVEKTLRYYDVERSDWTEREARRSAKAMLLELGISWHAESFAQCVREGDTKAVELFVASGFPPELRDKTGVPMLCLAARCRHRSIVELLLSLGADIDAQSDDRGYTPLMDAAQQGDMAMLDYLLGKGAQTNVRSKDGQTALILAVGRNDEEMVSRLLEYGADPDIADKLGLSARKYASLFKNPRINAELEAHPTPFS
ncbi:MAG: ankyrin repeat domain-containing protein [Spirochaetales bacterium]|nr:ankyrin repeat domain-containing protein [Spirochaetales bacterium]